MTTEDKIAASTENWCEYSDDSHLWSYTHHAGTPRIDARTCILCGFLSVEPVRELLRTVSAHDEGEFETQTDAMAWAAGAVLAWPDAQRYEVRIERRRERLHGFMGLSTWWSARAYAEWSEDVQ